MHAIRLAFRGLLKTPGFSVVATLTIAIAIGASTAVFSLVNALLIRPLPLVLIGTATGLLLGIFNSQALRAMLYNVEAFDLTRFAGVTLALSIVAILASYVPALRATRADPMIALGHG